jgi:hypothetical protein
MVAPEPCNKPLTSEIADAPSMETHGYSISLPAVSVPETLSGAKTTLPVQIKTERWSCNTGSQNSSTALRDAVPPYLHLKPIVAIKTTALKAIHNKSLDLADARPRDPTPFDSFEGPDWDVRPAMSEGKANPGS